MERLGTRDFTFLKADDLRRDNLSRLRAILIGGGDVEAMARELGEEGARGLEGVRARGRGLPGLLRRRLPGDAGYRPSPYTPFELIDAGVANYLPDPPPPPAAPQVQGGIRGWLHLPSRLRAGAGGPEEGSFLATLGEVTAALLRWAGDRPGRGKRVAGRLPGPG